MISQRLEKPASERRRIRRPSAAQLHGPVYDLWPFFARKMPLWKRLMDIAGSSLGLIVFSPLMLAAVALIRLTSNGPVLFVQHRAGVGGRPFRFFKFRTMVVNAESLKKDLVACNEQTGPVFKMRRDPRITRLGRILRITSVDELPQLWNVFKGDMSLVGPRPPTLEEIREYRPWQKRRLDVTPGLTCIWQVSGRSEIQFTEWVRMDIAYSRTVNLFRDLLILCRTIPAILTGRGAF
jgi:lipopolysaccharide/colanic/teichoic acid biosynthesis glycosyltransferase